MKRVQSAKPAARLQTVQSEHKRFSAFLKQLGPTASWTKDSKRESADLLMDLRKYRLHGATGIPPAYSSTNFSTFKKGILQSPKATSSRPASSPSKHVSILHTARSIDILPPSDPNYPTAMQEDASVRLHMGSRLEVSPRPETLQNPLFRFADMVDRDTAESARFDLVQREKKVHEEYLRSLRSLKKLAFEMNLNYETAHRDIGNEEGESSQLGAYYRLIEELQSDLHSPIETLLSEWQTGLEAKLVIYTKMIRSMLRGLRHRDLDNEATLMELIWKLVVKMFDTALELHQQTLDQTIESAKQKVRTEVERRRREVQSVLERWTEEETKLHAKLEKLSKELEVTNREKTMRERELAEKQEELAKLTDINVRENALMEMQHLYKKLGAYLSDSELEQTRQAAALEGVEVMMDAAKRFQPKPSTKSVSVQTDYPSDG